MPGRRPMKPPKKPPRKSSRNKTVRKSARPPEGKHLEGGTEGLKSDEMREAMQQKKSDIQKLESLLNRGMHLSIAQRAEIRILEDSLNQERIRLEKAKQERQLTPPEITFLGKLRELLG
ncbi:MAG: hypothetical protein V1672_03905 [Candidatus Diapherotrites archaeon]